MDFGKRIAEVREKAPLVQCITNFVTVNDCANIILASGGSPTMAQDIREVEEAVAQVQALVCNLGGVEKLDAMIAAGKEANRHGIPVVLDPVAAGGTTLRRQAVRQLLREVEFAVIRGNASEMRSLYDESTRGSGVDVRKEDLITEENVDVSIRWMEALARRVHSVIVVSGPQDWVTDGNRTMSLRNGCETMSRITGSGCMLTSLIGAFCGAMPLQQWEAACAGTAVMGVAGEWAEKKRRQWGMGNATFRTLLIDGVSMMEPQELQERVVYEIYKG